MNVLPAPVSPPRPAPTSGPPTGAEEAPTDFASVLAVHADEGAPPAVPAATPTADGPEPSAAPEPGVAEAAGQVAAAVHAAIAAWRADPADVALGAHLRGALEGTVRAVAAAADGAPSQPLPPDPGVPAPTGVTGAAAGADAMGAAVGEDAVDAEGLPPSQLSATVAEQPAPPMADDVPAASTAPAVVGRTTSGDATPGTPAPSALAAIPDDGGTAPVDAVVPHGAVDASEVTGIAPTPDPPAATGARADTPTVTSGATLDRVLRAVEALEHAPPPRRLAVEVEGVRLTVAMRGEEVSVAVRTGTDQLPPGWQRDLAAALRHRGLGLDTGAGESPRHGHGQERRRAPGEGTSPAPAAPTTKTTRPADPAGLRL